MLGFGAAGLSVDQIAKSIEQLSELDQNGQSWGSNLIHAPNEPMLNATAGCIFSVVFVGFPLAYMKLTPAVVRYALHGLHQTPDVRSPAESSVAKYHGLKWPNILCHLRHLRWSNICSTWAYNNRRSPSGAPCSRGRRLYGRVRLVVIPITKRCLHCFLPFGTQSSIQEAWVPTPHSAGAAGGIGTPRRLQPLPLVGMCLRTRKKAVSSPVFIQAER